MDEHGWLMAFDADHTRTRIPVGFRVPFGRTVGAGRSSELALAATDGFHDRGVSREAVVVTASEAGWRVQVHNRNGVVIHPWAQAPYFVPDGEELLSWPRIGIRVLNGVQPAQPGIVPRLGWEPADPANSMVHWLLFESDAQGVTTRGARAGQSNVTSTFTPRRPEPLTARQVQALSLVFVDYLAWPPVAAPEPRALDRVARHRDMDITANGVQNLLDKVIARARQHGLHGRVGRTDPSYLYVLVRAGYLAPPTTRLCRRPLYRAGDQ